MVEPTGIRSLDVVQEEVRAERAGQLANFDAIDTKAGILLGFAGALVALSREGSSLALQLGRGLGRLVDTHIEMAERMAEVIQGKAMTLKLAMISLAVAVLLVAVGLGLH